MPGLIISREHVCQTLSAASGKTRNKTALTLESQGDHLLLLLGKELGVRVPKERAEQLARSMESGLQKQIRK